MACFTVLHCFIQLHLQCRICSVNAVKDDEKLLLPLWFTRKLGNRNRKELNFLPYL